MLRTRLITAGILLGVVGLCLSWSPPSWWSALVALMVALACWEWSGLAGVTPIIRSAYLMGSMALYWGVGQLYVPWLVLSLGFWVIMAPLWLRQQWKIQSWLLLGIGWVVLLPSGWSLAALRQQGNSVMLALMVVVWLSDTAAYFAGKAWGKHKLAPSISPGKTWEGVVGALVAVTVYGVIWWWVAQQGGGGAMGARVRQSPTTWLPLLWALTALGVLGDLMESWLKRCAGVKDSGVILPGHGGVLDRVDALTSTLPLAMLWIMGVGK